MLIMMLRILSLSTYFINVCCRTAFALSVTVASVFSISVATVVTADTAQAQILDRIVAVVDDDIILESELEQFITSIRRQAREAGQRLPASGRELQLQALDRLILNRLQLLRAERAGMTVSSSQLTDAAKNIAQRNEQTLSEFITDLESNGVSYAQFRRDLKEEILSQQLRARQVETRVKISDQEVADAMLVARSTSGSVQYQLNHIMVNASRSADAETLAASEAKIKNIQARIQQGADFAETAVAFSDGQRALEGGSLGWMALNQLPSIFVEPVKALQVGQTSDIIRSPSGFHIIKLSNTRDPNKQTITEQKLRHILVKPTAVRSADEARDLIMDLRRQVEAGANFAELAKQYSEDPGSANGGGDLGWVKPGVMVKPFELAAQQLNDNELSQPVQSRFGWHLILSEGRRQRDVADEVLEASVRQQIYQRKVIEETDAWARELRDRAYVEIRL